MLILESLLPSVGYHDYSVDMTSINSMSRSSLPCLLCLNLLALEEAGSRDPAASLFGMEIS